MDQTFKPLQPKVILGVVAHPDDLEFTMAGTVAKYVADGAQVYYYILTNANKGTSDPKLSSIELRDMRRNEQRAAGRILGLRDIFFGDYDDGCLEVTMTLKQDIVRVIRTIKPDVVLTFDPTMHYDAARGIINHPDHRAAGQATLDAVYPLARDHLSCPALTEEEHLQPHKVSTVLMTHFDHENFYVDISEYIETKLAALRAHKSQLADPDASCEMVRQWAAQLGSKVGGTYAEGFVRVDIG